MDESINAFNTIFGTSQILMGGGLFDPGVDEKTQIDIVEERMPLGLSPTSMKLVGDNIPSKDADTSEFKIGSETLNRRGVVKRNLGMMMERSIDALENEGITYYGNRTKGLGDLSLAMMRKEFSGKDGRSFRISNLDVISYRTIASSVIYYNGNQIPLSNIRKVRLHLERIMGLGDPGLSVLVVKEWVAFVKEDEEDEKKVEKDEIYIDVLKRNLLNVKVIIVDGSEWVMSITNSRKTLPIEDMIRDIITVSAEATKNNLIKFGMDIPGRPFSNFIITSTIASFMILILINSSHIPSTSVQFLVKRCMDLFNTRERSRYNALMFTRAVNNYYRNYRLAVTGNAMLQNIVRRIKRRRLK